MYCHLFHPSKHFHKANSGQLFLRLACKPWYAMQAIQGQHRKQPKIPSKLLHSFAPRGPVFIVAAACHQFRARNPSVKKIDFLSPAKRTEVLHATLQVGSDEDGKLISSGPLPLSSPCCSYQLLSFRYTLHCAFRMSTYGPRSEQHSIGKGT